MVSLQEEKNVYLADFDRLETDLKSPETPPVHRLRTAAIARFRELGFPTARNEDWRFTNVSRLAKTPFRSNGVKSIAVTQQELDKLTLPAGDCRRLVFVNGLFQPELSDLARLPGGVVACSMADSLRLFPAPLERHLGRYADFENHAFTALNTAFIRDGAFVHIPRGVHLEATIYLCFITTGPGEGFACHPRNLIILEEGSQVRLVEHYVSLEENVYFTNAVSEVVLGPGAAADHYKIQEESLQAVHVAMLYVRQEARSNFTSGYIATGGALVRNEIRVRLDGSQSEATLNGLYRGSGQQHIDNHTVIDHAQPHCASHELYKGILDGRAHGVFNGKIFVHQDAQKTDAKQTNQTLLLSEDAVINTKPQLEIYADDVKCTHGATVGQLDAEALFYLRSRGIGKEEARALLTFAFANDIIDRVKIRPLREELAGRLLATGQLPAEAIREDL